MGEADALRPSDAASDAIVDGPRDGGTSDAGEGLCSTANSVLVDVSPGFIFKPGMQMFNGQWDVLTGPLSGLTVLITTGGGATIFMLQLSGSGEPPAVGTYVVPMSTGNNLVLETRADPSQESTFCDLSYSKQGSVTISELRWPTGVDAAAENQHPTALSLSFDVTCWGTDAGLDVEQHVTGCVRYQAP